MKKLQLLKIVNTVLLVSFIVQAASSLIIFFRIKLPNTPLVFTVHEYNGLLIIVLMVLHIWLNWGWIKMNILRK